MSINKLILAALLGVVAIILGGIMTAVGTYISNSTLYNNNCYNTYPPVYINGTYTYPSAYYTCETNIQLTYQRNALYASLLQIPGLVVIVVGSITVIVSIALTLIAVYKDRNIVKKK